MIALGICFALAFSADAHAKKRKKKRASPLNVVVVPFVGKGTGGSDVKEAIELELELVEIVQVSASDTLEGDLRKAGKRAFEAALLSSSLSRRGVDVLIRGERGPGEKNPDALLVVAYGRDGQPRFFKELMLGSEPDAAAATIVDALRPILEGWKSARPIRLPFTGAEDEKLDVLVDEDESPRVIGKKRGDDDAPSRATPVRDVLEDEPAPPKKSEPAKVTRNKSPLDFNEDDDKPQRRSRLDDDAPADAVSPRGEIGSDGRRRSIADLEDDELPEPANDVKLRHTFALSGAFDGGTWRYSFDGAGVGDTEVAATFYPGGSALVDVWPMSWLGADAEVAFAAVPFKINGGGITVTPGEFLSIQTRIGGAIKLRYTLKNGIGLGGRLGYRYLGASVEAQTVENEGQTKNLTVVPGYTLHAAAVGAEIFMPILIGGNRLEVDLRADGLPATYYAEQPDNPGRQSLAFGWAVSLATRYDLVSGFFLEARGQSTGTTVTYTEEGERNAFVGNQLQKLQGGSVLNLTAGFSVGVGFMF